MTGKEFGSLVVLTVLVASPVIFGIFGKVAEAGVSALGCSLALAFINLDKFKKFKGGGFEAELKDRVDAMVAAESEPEAEDEISGIAIESYGLGPAAQQVVRVLNNSKYTWRSVGGICEESGLAKKTVLRQLRWLEDAGLALKVGVSGRVNWGLTEKGRRVALFQ